MLLAANLIDEVQMQIALVEQKRTRKKFGSTLVDLKFIDENVLAAFLSKQIDVPCISLLHIDIPKKVLRRIPAKLARECRAIPVRMGEGRLEVAMADPTDLELIERLELASGMPVTPLIAPESSLEKMITHLYPPDPNDDDTLSTSTGSQQTANPMFADLIDEVESGDFEQRLDRIEENLNQIWTLAEKILRRLERSEAERNEDSRDSRAKNVAE